MDDCEPALFAVLNLEAFWQALDGPTALALSQTCHKLQSMALRFRKAELIIFRFSSKVTRYFAAETFWSFSKVCQLWERALPALELDRKLLKLIPNYYSPRSRRNVAYLIEKALDQSLEWKTVSQFSVSVPSGACRLGRKGLFQNFLYQHNTFAALSSIRFQIPAGEQLDADLAVGGLPLFHFITEAKPVASELSDKLFIRPLVFDRRYVGGLHYHRIMLRTNCPATITYSFERKVSDKHTLVELPAPDCYRAELGPHRLEVYHSTSLFYVPSCPAPICMAGMMGTIYSS